MKASGSFLASFLAAHRLTMVEVARAAGVSRSSMSRLRKADRNVSRSREATIRKVADALAELTHLDPDEIYGELMAASGRRDRVRQGDLGLRGSTELIRHYGRMSSTGRHLLLEQARLLSRVLPLDDE